MSSLSGAKSNVVLNNDVGVFAFNADAVGNPSPTATNVIIVATIASDDACFNASYQAGISAFGNTDSIVANYIAQGGGYGPSCGIGIDVTGSINPQVFLNNVPQTGPLAGEAAAPVSNLRAVPFY